MENSDTSSSAPKLQGRWSKEEEFLFLEGLRRFGDNWDAIAELIPSRSAAQVMSYVQNCTSFAEQPEYGIQSGPVDESTPIAESNPAIDLLAPAPSTNQAPPFYSSSSSSSSRWGVDPSRPSGGGRCASGTGSMEGRLEGRFLSSGSNTWEGEEGGFALPPGAFLHHGVYYGGDGVPLGMPQGMSQGMPQGMPQGMSHGIPQGMPQGMPHGMPQGMPQGMPHGMGCCGGALLGQQGGGTFDHGGSLPRPRTMPRTMPMVGSGVVGAVWQAGGGEEGGGGAQRHGAETQRGYAGNGAKADTGSAGEEADYAAAAARYMMRALGSEPDLTAANPNLGAGSKNGEGQQREGGGGYSMGENGEGGGGGGSGRESGFVRNVNGGCYRVPFVEEVGAGGGGGATGTSSYGSTRFHNSSRARIDGDNVSHHFHASGIPMMTANNGALDSNSRSGDDDFRGARGGVGPSVVSGAVAGEGMVALSSLKRGREEGSSRGGGDSEDQRGSAKYEKLVGIAIATGGSTDGVGLTKVQSQYAGVTWDRGLGKWKAQSFEHPQNPSPTGGGRGGGSGGKMVALGYFEDEETAARKYDERAHHLGKPMNFPTSPGQVRAKRRVQKSRYRGVSWSGSAKKWVASVCVGGKQTYLGSFDIEADAAEKYAEAKKLSKSHPAGFISGAYLKGGKSGGNSVAAGSKARRTTSPYRGVSWHAPLGRWKAEIQIEGKKVYLGYFDDEAGAARVYDSHAAKIPGRYLNFPNEDPNEDRGDEDRGDDEEAHDHRSEAHRDRSEHEMEDPRDERCFAAAAAATSNPFPAHTLLQGASQGVSGGRDDDVRMAALSLVPNYHQSGGGGSGFCRGGCSGGCSGGCGSGGNGGSFSYPTSSSFLYPTSSSSESLSSFSYPTSSSSEPSSSFSYPTSSSSEPSSSFPYPTSSSSELLSSLPYPTSSSSGNGGGRSFSSGGRTLKALDIAALPTHYEGEPYQPNGYSPSALNAQQPSPLSLGHNLMKRQTGSSPSPRSSFSSAESLHYSANHGGVPLNVAPVDHYLMAPLLPTPPGYLAGAHFF